MQGKEFESLTELSLAYNIDISVLSRRYRSGERGDELVKGLEYNPKILELKRKQKKRFEVNGERYTLEELASKYNLKEATIQTRYRRGYRGEELVAPPKKVQPIEIDGKVYHKLKDLAKDYDLPYRTVIGRRWIGFDDKDLTKPRRELEFYEPQIIFGISFPSFRAIADFFYEKEITLRGRYKKGLRNEQLIFPKGLPGNVYYTKSKKAYIYNKRYNGKRYEWSRKKAKDIIAVKNKVEQYLERYGEIPVLADPHADVDYKRAMPIGKVVGEWTIIDYITKNRRLYAVCRCSCGEVKEVYAATLYNGKSLSCGHVWSEKMKTDIYQNKAKDAQRKRIAPNVNNKLGERHITLDKRGRYFVTVVRHGIKVQKYFYKLNEAIAYRDKLIDDIDDNNGRIPPEYQKETKK